MLANRLHVSVALLAALLASCATSDYVLVGHARPPISPDRVTLYLEPPPAFEEVAAVDASSGSSLRSPRAKVDQAIASLRRAAAKLGANGLLLQSLDDDEAGTVGADVSKVTTTGDGQPFSLNLHASSSLFAAKLAHGMAIYVPPGLSP